MMEDRMLEIALYTTFVIVNTVLLVNKTTPYRVVTIALIGEFIIFLIVSTIEHMFRYLTDQTFYICVFSICLINNIIGVMIQRSGNAMVIPIDSSSNIYREQIIRNQIADCDNQIYDLVEECDESNEYEIVQQILLLKVKRNALVMTYNNNFA